MKSRHLVIALLLTFSVCNGAIAQKAPHHDHAAMSQKAPSSFESEMDKSMVRMMEDMHSPGYSGDADRDFLVMMVPHHQGAIDMAKLVLVHGRDPAVRSLAEDIIAGQTVEIESMLRRLSTLNKARSGADYPALGGVRGP